MKDFEEAVTFVLNHEGGYVNHPSDPGGETNFGISKRAYPDVDIKALTRDQAKAIYKRDYWDKLPSGLSDRVAAVVFDCAVNTGMSRAIRLLQKAVGTPDDGKWGDGSRAALGRLSEKEVVIRFATERIKFYAAISTFSTFGTGWVRRVLHGIVE